jgi:probable F420-dependent oxidoreductase
MKVRVGFGFGTTASTSLTATDLLSLIDHCEGLGWDSVWFSERITDGVLDPLALMAAVAGRTERIKFGPSVLVLPGRNPVFLAKELATIDQISGGRLVVAFGLGAPAGGQREASFVDRSEAAARTEEAVALIRRLWTEDGVTQEGGFYPVRDLTLGPRPVQRPHPDVWFGGHSSAALDRTGRLGDGWLPAFVVPEEYESRADVIRTAAARAHRVIDDEHYGALVPYVPLVPAVDPEPALSAIARRRPGVPPQEIVVPGRDGALRDRLDEFIERGASKFVVVPVVPPANWPQEVTTLRESVARPLE